MEKSKLNELAVALEAAGYKICGVKEEERLYKYPNNMGNLYQDGGHPAANIPPTPSYFTYPR